MEIAHITFSDPSVIQQKNYNKQKSVFKRRKKSNQERKYENFILNLLDQENIQTEIVEYIKKNGIENAIY